MRYDDPLPLFDGLYVRQPQNRFTEVWKGREGQLLRYRRQRVVQSPVRFAAAAADLKDQQALPAGQGMGLIRDVLPAGEVLQRLVQGTVDAVLAAKVRFNCSVTPCSSFHRSRRRMSDRGGDLRRSTRRRDVLCDGER